MLILKNNADKRDSIVEKKLINEYNQAINKSKHEFDKVRHSQDNLIHKLQQQLQDDTTTISKQSAEIMSLISKYSE